MPFTFSSTTPVVRWPFPSAEKLPAVAMVPAGPDPARRNAKLPLREVRSNVAFGVCCVVTPVTAPAVVWGSIPTNFAEPRDTI